MALEQITQHVEQGLLQLAPAFWGKPRISAYLTAFLQRIQDLEDDLWEMLTLRTLEGSDLPRLVVLGRIVGQPRFGFALESLRKLVEARGLANISKGRGDDLLRVLRLLFGTGNFTLTSMGNATLLLVANEQITEPELAEQVLPDTRSAGVQLHFVYQLDADVTQAFVWDDFTTSSGTPVWGVRTL